MKIEDKEQIIRALSQMRYKEGKSRKQMIDWMMKEYDLKMSRGYELIRDMMNEVASAYDETNPNALTDSIEFMEYMRSKAVSENNTKEALDWMKELNKIQQLYIQKLDITSAGEKITIIIDKNNDNDGSSSEANK